MQGSIVDYFGQHSGNKLYTKSEYDNLTGYIDRTYTLDWTGADGTLWRKIVTVINLGRPDRGVPVKPDAALMTEVMPGEGAHYKKAQTCAAKRVERHEAVKDILVAYLTEHGPTHTNVLLKQTMWKDRGAMREHYAMYPDVYLRYCEKPVVWGLYGQTYTPAPSTDLPPRAIRARDALLKYGPMTERVMGRIAGMHQSDANRAVLEHKDLFMVVGYEVVEGNHTARKWGVVGVHEVADSASPCYAGSA